MHKEWQPIFAQYHLSPASLSRLAQLLVPVDVPVGKIFQLEEEPCHRVYWVFSGALTAFRIAPDGRELTLQQLRRGDVFNLVSAFEQPPLTHAAVRALTDSRCLWLAVEVIPRLLQDCPDLSAALLTMFAQRLHHMTDLVEQIGLHSVRGRMARFLIDLGDGKLPPRQYTQDEMAAQIGTVRDMVGRTLKRFEADGLIERQRSHIMLKDRAGLEKEANK